MLIALLVIAAALAVVIAANDIFTQVFTVVLKGLGVTVFVTLVGFVLATVLASAWPLMALSEHVVLRQIARFYTEVIRGVPDPRAAVLYRLRRRACAGDDREFPVGAVDFGGLDRAGSSFATCR